MSPPPPPGRVLILGGTAQALELARRCAAPPRVRTVTSLAGVVSDPSTPAGEGRSGGFGGPDGLAAYLRAARIDAVVDATHPFATAITASAVAATAATGTPLLILRRAGWTEAPGDRWRRVACLAEAAALVPDLGHRVLLATGRSGLAPFAAVHACWFLARCIEPPAPPLPRRLQVLLSRGPFTLVGERALLAEHRIEVVVTKDSGGAAAAAKLTAARERAIPVVMVDRPPAPPAATLTDSVEAAHAWVLDVSRGARDATGTCP